MQTRKVRRNSRELMHALNNAQNIRVYSLNNNFSGQPLEAFSDRDKEHARNHKSADVTHDGTGEDGAYNYTFHIHSNLWYKFKVPTDTTPADHEAPAVPDQAADELPEDEAEHGSQKHVKSIMQSDAGHFETPKKLNRSEKEVPADVVQEIEEGAFTSEALEKLASKLPVFRYKTCVTVHGVWPEITRQYIGNYKNVTPNNCGSLAIKYSAIDAGKRRHIADQLQRAGAAMRYSESSTANKFTRPARVTRETYAETRATLSAHMQRVLSVPFLGKAEVNLYSIFGYYMLALEVSINCIAAENVQAITHALADMTPEQFTANAIVQTQKEEEEERESARRQEQYEADRAARLEKEAQEVQEKARQLAHMPPCCDPSKRGPLVKAAYSHTKGAAVFYFYRCEGEGSFKRVRHSTATAAELPADPNTLQWKEQKQRKLNEIILKNYHLLTAPADVAPDVTPAVEEIEAPEDDAPAGEPPTDQETEPTAEEPRDPQTVRRYAAALEAAAAMPQNSATAARCTAAAEALEDQEDTRKFTAADCIKWGGFDAVESREEAEAIAAEASATSGNNWETARQFGDKWRVYDPATEPTKEDNRRAQIEEAARHQDAAADPKPPASEATATAYTNTTRARVEYKHSSGSGYEMQTRGSIEAVEVLPMPARADTMRIEYDLIETARGYAGITYSVNGKWLTAREELKGKAKTDRNKATAAAFNFAQRIGRLYSHYAQLIISGPLPEPEAEKPAPRKRKELAKEEANTPALQIAQRLQVWADKHGVDLAALLEADTRDLDAPALIQALISGEGIAAASASVPDPEPQPENSGIQEASLPAQNGIQHQSLPDKIGIQSATLPNPETPGQPTAPGEPPTGENYLPGENDMAQIDPLKPGELTPADRGELPEQIAQQEESAAITQRARARMEAAQEGAEGFAIQGTQSGIEHPEVRRHAMQAMKNASERAEELPTLRMYYGTDPRTEPVEMPLVIEPAAADHYADPRNAPPFNPPVSKASQFPPNVHKDMLYPGPNPEPKAANIDYTRRSISDALKSMPRFIPEGLTFDFSKVDKAPAFDEAYYATHPQTDPPPTAQEITTALKGMVNLYQRMRGYTKCDVSHEIKYAEEIIERLETARKNGIQEVL
jgi:hypothetical protein